MRRESCSYPKSCPNTNILCRDCGHIKRYVRADVAMRYARMKERKAYYFAENYAGVRCKVTGFFRRTYDEAIAAQKTEQDGK